jgi:hypothetical protein
VTPPSATQKLLSVPQTFAGETPRPLTQHETEMLPDALNTADPPQVSEPLVIVYE